MSFITSIFGGMGSAHAAGVAANDQVGGAQEAAKTVTDAAKSGNTNIDTTATNAGSSIVKAGQDAGAGDLAATAKGGADVLTAGDLANHGLDPYAGAGSGAAGQLAAGLAPGGSLAKTFTAADMEANDPGYQFRLQQGQQAVQRAEAAMGESGGGEAKAIEQYAQGAGSQEYQNAFQRFTTNQQNNVMNLQNLANAGQTAATTQGGNTINTATTAANLANVGAQYAGNAGITTNTSAGQLTTQASEQEANNANTAAEYAGNAQVYAGNARATGVVGKQNAYNGMLSGIGQGIDDLLLA